MTEAKIIKMNGQQLENETLTPKSLKDLKDYRKDMEESNAKMLLLNNEQQAQEKNKRGRDWRGGYLMAMVILNANNSSIIALQKERDAWYVEWELVVKLLENAEKMVNIQTGLNQESMTRENLLKQEHQATIRKYQQGILTMRKEIDDLKKK